ncbi:MAG TPA: TlpA disulfide reductase family protein [Terriglobia bacterium]|nr:TlpA disulfide reductase family protein [Terriglobia bacterium]
MKNRNLFPILLLVLSPFASERSFCSAIGQAKPAQVASRTGSRGAETRVIDYIRTHLQPGQPLVVSELYSKVFTQPDERRALDKLYNAFFRIPLFLAQYQEKTGSPPRLATIAQQFDLRSRQEADVLLRVMESDPRVPRFLTRDRKTGEISRVDVAMIRGDERFGQAVERQLSGWEGKPAPPFRLESMDGQALELQSLTGKTVLLYVWFTGCPPCMKEAPALVALQTEFSARGFTVVGANADKLLGLGYGDDVRQRYIKEEKINFPVVNWTKESDSAYGSISIFPTLFLIDGKGIVARHWVGYVKPEQLRKAFSEAVR